VAWSYIIPLSISVFYYIKSKDNKFHERIMISAHGCIIIFASLYSVIASAETTTNNFKLQFYIFDAILVVAVLSIIYAYKTYKGSGSIHLSQIVNILIIPIFWFIGGMTLSHDWL